MDQLYQTQPPPQQQQRSAIPHHQQQSQQQQPGTIPNQQQIPPPPAHLTQPWPVYDPVAHGGHFGASSVIANSGYVPATAQYGGPFSNVTQGLQGNYRNVLATYWQQAISEIENEDHDFKVHNLPLARIKKVMKSDEDVKMISAEAPILFARGCDIFITELTMRAWIHAEENKRRTLQRSDIAHAISKSDMFDFLIDIVPRESLNAHVPPSAMGQAFEPYKRQATASVVQHHQGNAVGDGGLSGVEPNPPGSGGGNPSFGGLPYGDGQQGPPGINYQSGPLQYNPAPPGTSAGAGNAPYPHHPSHPLYNDNRYSDMYYTGPQPGLQNLAYPQQTSDHGHQTGPDPTHPNDHYNPQASAGAYQTGNDDVSHYYGSGGAR